ncbi:MAG: peptidase S58 [Anaerolineaceae bacterium]|nr:peptidase S58 [Anaerolineaceae bacterium]
MTTPTNNTLTAVPGFQVGHVTNLEAATGCTVVLCPEGTVGGVDQQGGAPGTRETDLLRPGHHVEVVNAVMLAGGSAYGLAAASGAMRYLEERELGYRSGAGHIVPIVPSAIVFDLTIGSPDIRPDADMGYAACLAANNAPVEQGTVGAGTGCRIGAMYGNERAVKGGLGSSAIWIDDELVVAALVVVNAVGDIIGEDGQIMAGLRAAPGSREFVGVLNEMRGVARKQPSIGRVNTVISVVATNAQLSKDHTNKLAQMASSGIARAINPAHTMFDGDTLFALASGQIPANVNAVGAYAAEAVSAAIRQAVRQATSLGGVRALGDFDY